jgi:hypothetical protein
MAPESVSNNGWETSTEARGHPLAEHLTVTRADHSQLSHNRLIGYCAQIIEDLSGPHCLAHYERGFRDFTVDVLNDSRLAVKVEESGAREVYARSFRQFILGVERFDRALNSLQSGELMRTVLETADGAIQCGRIRPGQYVVGTVAGVEDVDVMDERLARLVSRIRTELYHLPDEDPGGFRQLPGGAAGGGTCTSRKGPAMPGDRAVEDVRTVFESHLDPADLHYAALYRNWEFALSSDVLDSDHLGYWTYGVSANLRRDLYESVSQELRSELAQLGRAVRKLCGPPPRRLVLDVQAGALYVYFLGGEGDFLLGGTLDQSAVFQAEQRMRKIVGPVRELIQHR